jgi:hypothetical protein
MDFINAAGTAVVTVTADTLEGSIDFEGSGLAVSTTYAVVANGNLDLEGVGIATVGPPRAGVSVTQPTVWTVKSPAES